MIRRDREGIQDYIKNIQNHRTEIYGSYDKNVATRAAIEKILFDYNREKNRGTDLEFTENDRTMLRDIISKMVRLAADPSWTDSGFDMESYVNRFNEFNPRYKDYDIKSEELINRYDREEDDDTRL